MTLSPRAIALSGFGFGMRSVALQGFAEVEVDRRDDVHGGGRAKRIARQNQALIAVLIEFIVQGELE
jgi:hypothetical protein